MSILKLLLPKYFRTKSANWLRKLVRSLILEEKKQERTDWHTHPQVTIGRYTYGLVPESVPLMSCPHWRLDIGSFTSIAPGVRFVFGLHATTGATTFPIREFVRNHWDTDLWPHESIRVGNDVWLASNVLVLSGVTIGDGAVIGAGAVVTRDIPPYAVAAGVPARIVRWRMPEDLRLRMQAIRWWEWPDDKVLANEELLYGEPEFFAKAHSTSFEKAD